MAYDSDFIEELAKGVADRRQETNEKRQLQLHKAAILAAKLPHFFSDFKSAVQDNAKAYDIAVQKHRLGSATRLKSVDGGFVFDQGYFDRSAGAGIVVTYSIPDRSITFQGQRIAAHR